MFELKCKQKQVDDDETRKRKRQVNCGDWKWCLMKCSTRLDVLIIGFQFVRNVARGVSNAQSTPTCVTTSLGCRLFPAKSDYLKSIESFSGSLSSPFKGWMFPNQSELLQFMSSTWKPTIKTSFHFSLLLLSTLALWHHLNWIMKLLEWMNCYQHISSWWECRDIRLTLLIAN
jgi:hypothetical protein